MTDALEKQVESLARLGGAEALKRASEIVVSCKDGDVRNLVTNIDIAVSELLKAKITALYPEHHFFSEEGAHDIEYLGYTWVIDPIDGTSNYARGLGHYSCCVTLLNGSDVVACAVYQPVTDDLYLYTAQGAFCNGEKISVSSVDTLKEAYVNFHPGRKEEHRVWAGEVFLELLAKAKKTINLASSSLDLCYVAQGKVDIVIYGTLSVLDVAGAVAMVRAAGGEVYAYESKQPVVFSLEPQRIIATATPALLGSYFSSLTPK